MKIKIIEIISFLIIGVLKVILSLPNGIFLFLLKIINTGAKTINKQVPILTELIEIIQTDKGATNTLRNIVLQGNYSQLFYFLRGALIHQVEFLSPQIKIPLPHQPKKVKYPNLTVGICGDNFDLQMLSSAYQQKGCKVISYEKMEDILKDNNISKVNILETAYFLPENILEKILSQKISISLHFSSIKSPDMVEEIAPRIKTPFRIFYPYFYYPPVQIIKEMLKSNILGEVYTIRIRATASNHGGKFAPQKIEEDAFLSHPAFDHYLLLTFLGGKVEKVAAYLGKIDQEKGGQAVISCKLSTPLRYGLLEYSFAPDMYIYSQYFPYDLEIEIAGTDGIIWLNQGMANRTCEAPIQVRIGKRHYSLGIESFLQTGWESVYSQAVDDFILAPKNKINFPEIISAIKLKQALYKAGEISKVIDI